MSTNIWGVVVTCLVVTKSRFYSISFPIHIHVGEGECFTAAVARSFRKCSQQTTLSFRPPLINFFCKRLLEDQHVTRFSMSMSFFQASFVNAAAFPAVVVSIPLCNDTSSLQIAAWNTRLSYDDLAGHVWYHVCKNTLKEILKRLCARECSKVPRHFTMQLVWEQRTYWRPWWNSIRIYRSETRCTIITVLFKFQWNVSVCSLLFG